MAKITTITDINLRGSNQVIEVAKDSFIDVSENMAIFLCNEDIEAMTLSEQKLHSRRKKAIRTTLENINQPHQDYTFL